MTLFRGRGETAGGSHASTVSQEWQLGTPEELLSQLAAAHLYLATQTAHASLAPGGAALSALFEHDATGKRWLPVFTSESALVAYTKRPSPFARLGGRDVFALASREGIAGLHLDPAGPRATVIPLATIRLFLEGVSPARNGSVQIPAGSQIRFGLPAQEPRAELRRAIERAATSVSFLRCAYLTQVAINAGQPHLLLIVGFVDGATPEQIQGAAAVLGQAIQPVLRAGEDFDMRALAPTEEAALAGRAIQILRR